MTVGIYTFLPFHMLDFCYTAGKDKGNLHNFSLRRADTSSCSGMIHAAPNTTECMEQREILGEKKRKWMVD